MEADSDQGDNWERCNEASVGRALARQPNGRSGKNPAAIFLSLGSLGGLMGETCEESEPVVSLWCDSWEGTVTKLAGGLLFFLPLPYLVAVITLHYTTLHYFGAVFHYFTLLYSILGRCFHYFSLLFITWDIILYFTLHYPILYFGAAALLYSMCALLYTTLFLAAAILYLYADVAIA